MKQFVSPNEIKVELQKYSDRTIGFVPTMGSLHKGHFSLIKLAKEQNDLTVVSIYLNQTQFDNADDYIKYPIQKEQDVNVLEELDVDILFTPDYKSLYPDDYKFKVQETELSKILCGAKRNGHFEGVLTVVMKLLNIVRPTKSYFGEKDYQQLKLIKGMVDALFLDTKIVSGPTVREKDGLALSSRNLHLSTSQRRAAKLFPQFMKSLSSDNEITNKLLEHGFKVDYITTIDQRRYGAVFLGTIRLIDNVKV